MESEYWRLNNTQGVPVEKVTAAIKSRLRKQRGNVVSINKIQIAVENRCKVVAWKPDLYKLMLTLGAKVVASSNRNRWIFDVTDCLT